MTEWWTLAMDELKLRTLRRTGTRLRRRPWLKLLPRSLSPTMRRRSCCSNLWPTLLVVAMGQGMLPLQLWPPTVTSWPLIHWSSQRQESLLRSTIGFMQSSPSLGSYAARRCRRLSSPRSNCVVTPARGGPTTLSLALRTTRSRGLSFVVLSAPTTFQQFSHLAQYSWT
jgi:hypothetical protein